MIEVEKTYALTPDNETRLTQSATYLKTVTLEDVYYDSDNFRLTGRDWWLRSRNGKFELKIAHGDQQPIRERQHDQYRELETDGEIKTALQLPARQPLALALVAAGLKPFARIVTTRRKYQSGDLHIDLDEMDFGYACVDIERLVARPEEVGPATASIVAFARRLGLTTDQVAGKVIEFLRRKRANHYQVLVEAGVV